MSVTVEILHLRCVICERVMPATREAWEMHGDDCRFCGATAALRITDLMGPEPERPS